MAQEERQMNRRTEILSTRKTRDVISRMREIQSNLPRMDFDKRTTGPRLPSEFDPNSYFKALKHISLPSGFVLDYFYFLGESGGGPELYVRHESDTPIQAWPSVRQTLDDPAPLWMPLSPLSVLIPDRSPESWFELVAFAAMAPQFYLYWHANYNDWEFIVSDDQLEILVKECCLDDSAASRARELGCDVEIETVNDSIFVTYTGFTRWGGFKRTRTTISARTPHVLLGEAETVDQVPYDCGICY